MSKAKGRRTRRKAREYYENKGYSVEYVEKTSKFARVKDLFGATFEAQGGFDILAIHPKGEVVFVQVKTNKPPTQEFYRNFAEEFCNDTIKCVCMTWYDHKGWRIQEYKSDGTIEETDLR